jgi:hypothetical protein
VQIQHKHEQNGNFHEEKINVATEADWDQKASVTIHTKKNSKGHQNSS